MTISKNTDLRVNKFYTHDIKRQKEQRSGLNEVSATGILHFHNHVRKHKQTQSAVGKYPQCLFSALVYICKVESTTNKRHIIEWSCYMYIIKY